MAYKTIVEDGIDILVAGAGALDRYVATHPRYLFEATPEEARLDPDNMHVLLAHLRAAAFELPFSPGEPFGSAPADDLLAFLSQRVRQGRRPRSLSRYLSGMRQFYRWALREGRVAQDPSALIDSPRLGRSLPKALGEEQVELVRNYLLGLQDNICAGIEKVDGGAVFREDDWSRGGGGGEPDRLAVVGDRLLRPPGAGEHLGHHRVGLDEAGHRDEGALEVDDRLVDPPDARQGQRQVAGEAEADQRHEAVLRGQPDREALGMDSHFEAARGAYVIRDFKDGAPKIVESVAGLGGRDVVVGRHDPVVGNVDVAVAGERDHTAVVAALDHLQFTGHASLLQASSVLDVLVVKQVQRTDSDPRRR